MEQILEYLSGLDANNNRDWYHSHKEEGREAVREFEELIGELMLRIGTFDSSVLGYEPSQLTFKLVRDTRFSKDKSPYNPAFRAHISSKGKLPIPVGYYLMIGPGGRSFLGGGLFASVFKDATAAVRDHIAAYGDELQRILSDKDFAEHFHVDGEKLKNVPQGYLKEHPQAEWLKYKSWYLEYPVKEEELLAPDFVDTAAEVFRLMKPFNDYLNTALRDFKMPERP